MPGTKVEYYRCIVHPLLQQMKTVTGYRLQAMDPELKMRVTGSYSTASQFWSDTLETLQTHAPCTLFFVYVCPGSVISLSAFVGSTAGWPPVVLVDFDLASSLIVSSPPPGTLEVLSDHDSFCKAVIHVQ